jgi:hypothetical protein
VRELLHQIRDVLLDFIDRDIGGFHELRTASSFPTIGTRCVNGFEERPRAMHVVGIHPRRPECRAWPGCSPSPSSRARLFALHRARKGTPILASATAGRTTDITRQRGLIGRRTSGGRES